MKNFKYKFLNVLFVALLLFTDNIAFAQNSNNSCSVSKAGAKTTFKSLLEYFTCIINSSIIPFLFAIAIIAFLWGVVQFFLNGENESEREKGKEFMIWGIIALTVMITVWGIVAIVGGSFGFEVNVIPQVGL